MYCTPHIMRMSSASRTKNVRNVRRPRFAATAADAARSLTLLMDDLQEEAICARIQKARKEAGLNQDEFAELLEVIKRTVQNYESNRVPWSKMGQISEITGKSTRWLLLLVVESRKPAEEVPPSAESGARARRGGPRLSSANIRFLPATFKAAHRR
jgi:DNA-binding transcriptional regulator YiaG